MTGTAAQVTAITKVDHRPIGKGSMGPIVSRLREMFEEIVRGRNKKYEHWIISV
jgi:branched-chain amino acid aminotransferase